MKRMDGQSMIEKIEMERKERREKREREREKRRGEEEEKRKRDEKRSGARVRGLASVIGGGRGWGSIESSPDTEFVEAVESG